MTELEADCRALVLLGSHRDHAPHRRGELNGPHMELGISQVACKHLINAHGSPQLMAMRLSDGVLCWEMSIHATLFKIITSLVLVKDGNPRACRSS